MASGDGQVVPRKDLVRQVQDGLMKYEPQIKRSVPAFAMQMLNPERVVQLLMTECGRIPGLLECSPASIVGGMLTAASLGLEVGAHLGHAYLVPFKGKATFVAGYRGLIMLATRSGYVESVSAYVVRKGDKFTCRLGTEGSVQHEPELTDPPSEILAYYAIARMKGGGYTFDRPMLKSEAKTVQGRSPAGRSGPWVTDFDEMAKKTVVRRLCKYLPLSGEATMAAILDGAVEDGIRPPRLPNLDFLGDEAFGEPDALQSGADPLSGEVVDEEREMARAERRK